MKKKIKIPKFESEDKERDFWSKVDLSEHFDKKDFQRIIFPNLKPTTRAISLRLPVFIINRAKEKANEIDVPYQSLMKSYIVNGVANREPLRK